MQKRTIIPGFLMLSLIFCSLLLSCEDVINVKLKDSSPRLVIEGKISNKSDSVKILLHRSTDFFTPSDIVSVDSGIVNLSDTRGNSWLLSDNSNGIYSVSGFHARTGVQYTLDVTVDGVDYTANATMPSIVSIDSLTIDRRPDRLKENRINIFFRDPPGVPNYYQVKVFRNGLLLNSFNHFVLNSDKYYDGKNVTVTLNAGRFDLPRFEARDTIKVQLINIDKMLYDYYQILHDITDEGNILSASTPSNPPNNLSNGALGYFTAVNISEKSIIVK